METKAVGFVGLGSMGAPIAKNVLEAGYHLRVYNRDARKGEDIVKAGAQRGEGPADVVEAGGIVITMLANDEAVESVTQNFLPKLGPGGVHVSMSTISPSLSRRMVELHKQHECDYVTAPVFGRPDAAAAKKLWIVVAGDEQAKERVKPMLAAVSQGIFDYGDDPAIANIIKIGGNFMIASAMEAMGEMLTLAEKNGVDRSKVIDMFTQTLFGAPAYKNYGPAIAERKYEPVGFQLKLALKDLNLILGAAEEAQMPMPLANLLHDRLLRGVSNGRGGQDWVALTQTIDEDAGVDKE